MTDSFARLIALQDRDIRIDQLRHRRGALPQHEDLAAKRGELADIERTTAEPLALQRRLSADQVELEKEISTASDRKSQIEKRMLGGTVTSSRDLQAMDEEVGHLADRINGLEDQELELMEQIEPLDAELAVATGRRVSIESDIERLIGEISVAQKEIDIELAGEVPLREEDARAVPDDLLAKYDKIRSRLGGVGAARVVHGSCGGCHLALPAMEIDRIAKADPDSVVTCEQCGRILVH